ncbi:unnamed protein product [Mortierella alpina]
MMAPHRNPNGCPIKATWFAQTMYSDYSLIQQWYAAGNEVADHTMTHVGTPPLEEIVGNRQAINAFAGIPFNKLAGFRAPFLNYSEATFQILGQEKFLYDSSTNAVPTDAYWPYTLDHGLANDCWNKICEKPITVPGMWEIPMHAIMDGNTTTAIAHAMDVHLDGTAEAVGGWLKANFDRHYDGNRAPFGIYLHPVHVGASAGLYHDLFTYAAAKSNVWFVTNQQLLQWMQNPVPASEMAAQDYMKCTLPAVGKEIAMDWTTVTLSRSIRVYSKTAILLLVPGPRAMDVPRPHPPQATLSPCVRWLPVSLVPVVLFLRRAQWNGGTPSVLNACAPAPTVRSRTLLCPARRNTIRDQALVETAVRVQPLLSLQQHPGLVLRPLPPSPLVFLSYCKKKSYKKKAEDGRKRMRRVCEIEILGFFSFLCA